METDGAGHDVPAAVAGRGTFDEDDLRRRMSGDDALMAEVLQLFLEDLPVRLAAIEAAVTAGNADALRTAAHALRGAAGNVSAGGLFDAARVLERAGAESRMDAADAAWRQLSIEAGTLTHVLRRHAPSATEPSSCES